MNKRFLVLSFIAKLLWGLGWIIAVGGIVYGLEERRIGLLIGIVVLALGLFIVAVSEIIGVLFAIEENTRTKAGGDLPLAKVAADVV